MALSVVRRGAAMLAAVVLAAVLPAVLPGRPAAAASGTRLGSGTGLYPRLVRLAGGDILASTVSFDPTGYGAIWRSTDGGATFSRVGTVRDPAAAAGLCCTDLYELPGPVGGLAAGTLLLAGSMGQDGGTDRRMSLDLWASTDHGASWSELSVVAAAPNAGGLWEPELHRDAAGRLQVFYSDETQQPAHSQVLMAVSSTNGVTWSAPRPVVRLADSAARPGMAVVRQLPGGGRIMTYEICGSTYHCDVYYRTSPDGTSWGAPTGAGTRIVSNDGRWFRHAPTTTVTANGTIVLVGQLLYGPSGVDAGNGVTLLTNSTGGTGAWHPAAAPVRVPTAYDNYCPNYSSALLPVTTGILEIATDYAGTTCAAYYATGRVAARR